MTRSVAAASSLCLSFALLSSSLIGCAHDGDVRVFVRDPRAVWVESSSPEGRQVVLPRGGSFSQVSVPINNPPFSSSPATATVFREPNGGITIDYPVCTVSPYAALHPSGELTVVPDDRSVASEVVASDGPNLRLLYRCRARGSERGLDLTLVTPWSNVREIHEYGRW